MVLCISELTRKLIHFTGIPFVFPLVYNTINVIFIESIELCIPLQKMGIPLHPS